MMKKIVNILILAPIGIVLIVLSVANRQPVTLALNPFRPEDSMLSVTAPFVLYLFLAVILGMIIGSAATWISQGTHRKRARTEASEAVTGHTEAEKHKSRAEAATAQNLLPSSAK